MPRRGHKRQAPTAVAAASRPTAPYLRATVLSRFAGAGMVARTERKAARHRADESCDVRHGYLRNGADAVGRTLSNHASPVVRRASDPRAHIRPSRYRAFTAAVRAADAAA